jgi:hypothetical protein
VHCIRDVQHQVISSRQQPTEARPHLQHHNTTHSRHSRCIRAQVKCRPCDSGATCTT